MDNNNNSNSSNNPPAPWTPTTSTPPADNPVTPTQTPQPDPMQSSASWPSAPTPDPLQPTPPTQSPYIDPLTTQPQPTASTPTFDSSPAQLATASQPESVPSSQPDANPSFQPTWQPPTTTTPTPEPVGSSLDNPWGAPSQVPPLDGNTNSWPTTPTAPQTEPAPNPQPDFVPTEANSAPTDLSHLISNAPSPTESQQPPTAGEALAPQPTNSTPEIPALPSEAPHGKIPKWVIGLGIGLLIVVAGVSGYFILGIGQSGKTTSAPATIATPAPRVSTPAPVSQPTATPAASGSASFGELEGNTTKQATSAADLLRQRQQGQ